MQKQFQFNIVRLRVKYDVGEGKLIEFQFNIVRLRVAGRLPVEDKKRISIQHCSIKRKFLL